MYALAKVLAPDVYGVAITHLTHPFLLALRLWCLGGWSWLGFLTCQFFAHDLADLLRCK